MLWANIYLRLNSMSMVSCMVGASVGYFLYVYAGGYILEHVGARYMMVAQLTYSVLALLTFLTMELFVRCFSQKHRENNPDHGDVTDEFEIHSMIKDS